MKAEDESDRDSRMRLGVSVVPRRARVRGLIVLAVVVSCLLVQSTAAFAAQPHPPQFTLVPVTAYHELPGGGLALGPVVNTSNPARPGEFLWVQSTVPFPPNAGHTRTRYLTTPGFTLHDVLNETVRYGMPLSVVQGEFPVPTSNISPVAGGYVVVVVGTGFSPDLVFAGANVVPVDYSLPPLPT